MHTKTGDERAILSRLHAHLAQTVRVASLLHDEHDDLPEIEHVRDDIAAAIGYLEQAIAAMEASIAECEAETRGERRIG